MIMPSDRSLCELISRVLLPRVKTPAQYIGGEINQIKKPLDPNHTSVALAFPDTYAVGMSHLGLSILYKSLNDLPQVRAERTYCPWIDAVEVMRRHDIPLWSWEHRLALCDFDILAISLQNEQCYSNVLMMLDLGRIPFYSRDRGEGDPIVLGGGTMSDCCEPIADFMDLVIVGDGEDSLPALILEYRRLHQTGLPRRELLLQLGRTFEWLYVPQFYQDSYNGDGTLASIVPTEPGLPERIAHARVESLPDAAFPLAPVVPHTEVIHDRIPIEVMRGCPKRCAFCHAGFTRGKTKYRSPEQIVDIAWQSYLNTGHQEVSLLSLSTSDYPYLKEATTILYKKFEGLNVNISLPSLRIDKTLTEVPLLVSSVRKGGLTIAVEAARDSLRKAIGKLVTEGSLLETLRKAYEAGWRRCKLYFMIGFPGETEADIKGIADLMIQVSELGREVFGRPATAGATVSWLVPKPHTPFSWIPQRDRDYFYAARRMLLREKHRMKHLPIKFRFHEIESSVLEGVIARADRRIAPVLLTAYQNGACFDAWSDQLDYDIYLRAFAEHNIDPSWYANRLRNKEEALPWRHFGKSYQKQLVRMEGRLMEKIEADNQEHAYTPLEPLPAS